MREEEDALPVKLSISGNHFDDLYATAAQMMDGVEPALPCELTTFQCMFRSHRPYRRAACDSYVRVDYLVWLSGLNDCVQDTCTQGVYSSLYV